MKPRRLFWLLISPIVFVLFWFLLVEFKIIPAILFPSPVKVFGLFFDTSYWQKISYDILLTLLRLIVSFILSVMIGVPIGFFIGHFKKANYASAFLIDFFRSIPIVALFPLFLVLLGIGNMTIISTAVWSGSFVMIVNSAYGVKNGNLLRRQMAKVFGSSTKDIFFKIIFYDSLPYVFSGFRITISMCLIVVVLSEMLLSSCGGLGQQVYDSALLFRSDNLYASIILLGVIGYSVNRISLFMEHKVVHWKEQSENN